MATSTASGHQVVALREAVACSFEGLACSFTIIGGNTIRLQRAVIRDPDTERAGIALGDGPILRKGYFLSTVPFSITALDGVSGFMLSSAVMMTSKSLYVVAAFRLPSRFSFTRNAPSNSGSLPRGCTQTR